MIENRSAWRISLGGLLTLAVAVGIGRFLYTPILPSMIADLGFSKTQAGWIASANYFGYLVGALVASSPKLRGSRRFWMIVGLFLSGMTTAAIGLLFDLVTVMGFRFIGGIASAFAFVYSSTLVVDQLIRISRAELSAIHFGGVGLGIALSALIVSGSVSFGFDWRWQWFGGGIASLLLTILVCQLVSEQVGSRVIYETDKRSSELITLIAAYGLFGFGYIITATFLMTIVRDTDGIRQLEPVIWLVVGLVGFPSVVIWMRISNQIGVLKTFSLACISEAIGIWAYVLWPSPVSFLITGVLLGGTFIALTALGLVGARTLTKGDPRQVVGLMTASFGCGQIVGPSFAGILHDITGSFTPALMTSVVALFISSIMVLCILKCDS